MTLHCFKIPVSNVWKSSKIHRVRNWAKLNLVVFRSHISGCVSLIGELAGWLVPLAVVAHFQLRLALVPILLFHSWVLVLREYQYQRAGNPVKICKRRESNIPPENSSLWWRSCPRKEGRQPTRWWRLQAKEEASWHPGLSRLENSSSRKGSSSSCHLGRNMISSPSATLTPRSRRNWWVYLARQGSKILRRRQLKSFRWSSWPTAYLSIPTTRSLQTLQCLRQFLWSTTAVFPTWLGSPRRKMWRGRRFEFARESRRERRSLLPTSTSPNSRWGKRGGICWCPPGTLSAGWDIPVSDEFGSNHSGLSSSFYSFLCFRCHLCSLTGEQLEEDEELRKELFHLEAVADNLYEVGLTGQGLRKLEEKLELIEKHWEEFCMEVPLLNHLLDLKLLWFSSCQRCTTDVSWPLLKQERERRGSCIGRSR